MDLRLIAATITSMSTDTLSEQLLDSRDECLARWQVETRESDVSGLEAARQRRSVVRFRYGNLLRDDVERPEGIGFLGLCYSVRSYACIGPGYSCITVEEGPVALRC